MSTFCDKICTFELLHDDICMLRCFTGKLKKLTRKSEERDFGSGSDISSFSVQSSATSVFQKAQEKAKKRYGFSILVRIAQWAWFA